MAIVALYGVLQLSLVEAAQGQDIPSIDYENKLLVSCTTAHVISSCTSEENPPGQFSKLVCCHMDDSENRCWG